MAEDIAPPRSLSVTSPSELDMLVEQGQGQGQSAAGQMAQMFPSMFVRGRPGVLPINPGVIAAPSTDHPVIDKLAGLHGQERYQLWPERVARGVWTDLEKMVNRAAGRYEVSDTDPHGTGALAEQSFNVAGALGTGAMPFAQKGALGALGGKLPPRVGEHTFGDRLPGVSYMQSSYESGWTRQVPANEPHRSAFIAQKETEAAQHMDALFDYSNSPSLMLMEPYFWEIAKDFAQLKGVPLSEAASTLGTRAFALKGSEDILTKEAAQEFINQAHSMVAKNKNTESWAGKLADQMGPDSLVEDVAKASGKPASAAEKAKAKGISVIEGDH